MPALLETHDQVWHWQSPHEMHADLHTSVCDLLGCEYPVILAGMGGVARAELVAAVSEAGGYGFLGMVREPAEFIRAQIHAVRALTRREFGVNLIPAATPASLLEAQLRVCLSERVNSICLFWDVDPALIAHLRDAGIIVVAQVGSAAEAEQAVSAGVHMVVVQGIGAGGHVRGLAHWSELVPEIAARCDVPIVAAGGIVDGAGLAKAISLGADGVMLGTALLATDESFAHPYHKMRIVEGGPGETVHTDSFHWNWPSGAPVRVLPNSVTRGERGDPYQEPPIVIGHDDGRPIALFSTDSPLRTTTGDLEAMALYAGDGAAMIDRIVPARKRIASIIEQASRFLSAEPAPRFATSGPASYASSACGAWDADDAYMGYAPREEILHVLNRFLEAKRGSARATIRLATAFRDRQERVLMHRVYHDDADCCRSLIEAIAGLGGIPSRDSGGFHRRVVASDSIFERLAFLQQGQDRIVKQVRRMLPRVRDDNVYGCLVDILRRHVLNMDAIARLFRADVRTARDTQASALPAVSQSHASLS